MTRKWSAPGAAPDADRASLLAPPRARDRAECLVGPIGAMPYGASARREGVNFSVFSRHATAVSLVLFSPGESEPVLELPLDPRYNKTGDVWHVFVCGLDPGVEYGFRADCEDSPAPRVLRFDRSKILIDPYSKSVAGLETWGEVAAAKGRLAPRSSVRTSPRASPAKPPSWIPATTSSA